MLKNKRITSMIVCAVMMLSVFTFFEGTSAIAATPGNTYTVINRYLVGDQMTTDYGQGRFARAREGGGLYVSGSFRENGLIPSNWVDFRLEWYNPATDRRIYTDFDWYYDDFEAEFDTVPSSFGERSYYTGFTTHWYDITQVRVLVYDEELYPYDELNPPAPIATISLGNVYLINRVI